MKLIRLLCAPVAALALIACDIRQEITLTEDGMVTQTQTVFMDFEACRIAEKAQGEDFCTGTGPDGKMNAEYDPDQGAYRILDDRSDRAETVAEFVEGAKLNRTDTERFASLDEEARVLTVRMPVAAFQNLSRGPSSVDDMPKADATALAAYGPAEAHEGNTLEITFTAPEILETNGELNAEGTTATFTIPSLFVALGMGDAGYDDLYVKARY